ncbi:ABC transporter ATP-binding protein [Rhodococcus sp. LW-XY12]|uniref:ABC transporter ATP-binding protein n=1 Tax=Rhodococcus sp. LW-XY12 TaxID=2856851 RepID=UPI001C56BEE5|nr:DUF2232 domain-containing protein [Rhodococcus sp. LW-XY12]QXU55049.1 DUF2232 domain-containing protein [Rhodococcus sp. LW-XY12]
MTRTRGPLRPPEAAAAAVFGTLTAVLSVVAGLIPVGVAQVLVALPVAFLAATGRLRAIVAATVAAGVVALVAGGPFAVAAVVVLSGIGTLVGFAHRRWGHAAVFVVLAGSVPAGLLLAAAACGLLLLFDRTRVLLLEALEASMRGTLRAFEVAGAGQQFVDTWERTLEIMVRLWWVWIGGAVLVGTVGTALLCFGIFRVVALRSTWATRSVDWPEQDPTADPAPLPVALRLVGYRYPGTDRDALSDIDLTIGPGEFVAIVGGNGSGKSTLVRLLAGLEPTVGLIDRPGSVGPGRPGGTAMILQHPESQVLGRTVAEDLRWGIDDVDVDDLLARVGLVGMEDRATEDLSGGQLQRLALAGALARRPALLIADEITAMVDADSRADLIRLLADVAREGTAVVLVTHLDDEARAADRIVHIDDGRIVPRVAAPPPPAPVPATVPSFPQPILELRDVTHIYAAGTPWAHTALRDVSLTICRGEGVLVVGENGSGKSTLAWIVAGLMRPTRGTAVLHDTPTADLHGEVGMVFQQARLQLQRPTVAQEISEVAGLPHTDRGYVAAVLHRVGLRPELIDRPIDRLSGGEMRRVAIAAQLARTPRVLVLDEPLAGLDLQGRREVVSILAHLRAVEHVTVVVISHDLHGMEEVCSRTVVLEDGRIVEQTGAVIA